MWRLLRAQARRDRWQLAIWILGTGLFAVFGASAVVGEFAGPAERTTLIRLASANPAVLAIRGVPDGVSPGAVIDFSVFTYLAILAAMMSTFLTVRHSRGDEEQGRAELIGATAVGRASALAATLALGALANIGIAVVITLGFAAAALPLAGSLLTGVAAGAVGLAFCGLAAVAAQLATSSRAANSLAGAAIGIAFLLRAAGDAFGTSSVDGLTVTSAWPSWLSPIGWGQQVRPFGSADPAPLTLALAVAVVTGVGALVIARGRDLGSGIVGERPGRARASAALTGSFGLAWRLQRSTVIGWAAGAAVLGLFAGGLAGPVSDAVQRDATIRAIIERMTMAGAPSLLDTFVAAIMGFLGVLAAGVAIQAVLRARSEEAEGRSELILAGSVDRARVVLDALAVAVISIVIVLLVGGLTAGLAFAAVGQPDRFVVTMAAALVQFPAAAMFAAASAIALALVPRLSVTLGWSLLALGFVLGQFGGLFGLPEWARDISPFTHTPVIPGTDAQWLPAVWLLAIAAAASLAATMLARRRDLVG
jgi:ABC-2 type transport system permease protein